MTPAESYERVKKLTERIKNAYKTREDASALRKEKELAIREIIPEVGRGCTICYYSDKRAATITEVEYTKAGKPKAVIVTHNKTKCIDYFADKYEILPELEEGRTDRFTLRRNGRWYMDGQETSPHSVILMLHYQMHSIDPHY